MFKKDVREKLAIRLGLDQIEAESEEQHAKDGTSPKIIFEEKARRSLEKILTQSPEERIERARKEAQIRNANLHKLSEAFTSGQMSSLQCSLRAHNTPIGTVGVFVRMPDGEQVRLCLLVIPLWLRLNLKQYSDHDVATQLYQQIEQGRSPIWVLWNIDKNDSRKEHIAKADASLRLWLQTNAPSLAEAPITWKLPEIWTRLWRKLERKFGWLFFLAFGISYLLIAFLTLPIWWPVQKIRHWIWPTSPQEEGGIEE